jgi:hypothetical protein
MDEVIFVIDIGSVKQLMYNARVQVDMLQMLPISKPLQAKEIFMRAVYSARCMLLSHGYVC